MSKQNEPQQKIANPQPCAVRLIEEMQDGSGATFGLFTCDTHRINFTSDEENPCCPISRRRVPEARR